ncbi:hypothetical protein MLD38_009512 [Melastoma candidum]|uniref:Uncharacterized protein n=1 Tax=Melastoma candidum TaxID=119954 RepID=A0ACB9S0W1_9MYRT|nr:hypothetical protein MLD38_009512 [Melastoma candidum]
MGERKRGEKETPAMSGNSRGFTAGGSVRECVVVVVEASWIFTEASKVYDVLEDIMANVFSHLHEIQKHLQYWQVRAEDSDVRKICFMIFGRGPRAFVKETTHMIRYSIIDGSPVYQLVSSASVHIFERMAILSRLRCLVAGFLAEVYVEVDRLGEELVKSPKKMLPTILSVVNGLFIKLEGSVQSLNLPTQVTDNCSLKIIFWQNLVPSSADLHGQALKSLEHIDSSKFSGIK